MTRHTHQLLTGNGVQWQPCHYGVRVWSCQASMGWQKSHTSQIARTACRVYARMTGCSHAQGYDSQQHMYVLLMHAQGMWHHYCIVVLHAGQTTLKTGPSRGVLPSYSAAPMSVLTVFTKPKRPLPSHPPPPLATPQPPQACLLGVLCVSLTPIDRGQHVVQSVRRDPYAWSLVCLYVPLDSICCSTLLWQYTMQYTPCC